MYAPITERSIDHEYLCVSLTTLLIANEHSERSEHTVILSLKFLSILYIYSVTKILRKIYVRNFTANYRESHV